MSIVTSRVGAGADDTFYRQNGATPTLSSNANDAPVGLFDSTQTDMGTQMRFTNISIPRGAYIVAASLTLVSSGSDSLNTVNSRLRAVASDNVLALTTTATDITNTALLTVATVSWDAIAATTNGIAFTSPDISVVIQEIINRPGWTSGNAIAIQWDDIEGRTTQITNTLRRGVSYDNVPASAPLLSVTWSNATQEGTGRYIKVGDGMSRSEVAN